MKKLVDALKHLLPEETLKEVSAAVDEMFEEAVAEVTKKKDAEFSKQLEEAYSELAAELKNTEKIGVQGYEEAWAMILDLRKKIGIVLLIRFHIAMDE